MPEISVVRPDAESQFVKAHHILIMQAPSSPSRSRHSKNTPPHQRGSSQRHPPQHNTQPNSNRLYLRVSRKFLRRLPESTGTQQFPPPLPPLPNASGNLYVFDADLSEISSYAGNTVNWLIKIARLIFEPLGTSFLYTFRTGSVDYWWAREAEASRWERVHQGEQLKATIYEFRPNNNAHITLTQISLRQMRSVTTNTSEDRASVFRNALTLRDQTCVISHTPIHTIASHLIPRRLGDAGVRHVMTRFAGSASAQLDRYDPTIGILLYGPLDQFTDTYKLGYWNVGVSPLPIIITLQTIYAVAKSICCSPLRRGPGYHKRGTNGLQQ